MSWPTGIRAVLRTTITLALFFLPAIAAAQDRSGRDTASDWVVRHYKPFGLWDSICDERMERGVLKQRCYLRYVDVYSPRPDFLATFAFIHPQDGATIVEFGFERGTRFEAGGFHIEREGATAWTLGDRCLQSPKCELAKEEAANLLSAFSKGGVLVQQSSDRRGTDWQLEWDLARFGEALADYRQASAERSLLK